MKITMYELLGMVKDGKAPKKVRYEDDIYDLTEYENDYYNKEHNIWFTSQICSLGSLNDEVEILEEEKKIPEKLNWEPKESMAGQLTQKEQIEVIARRTEKLKKEFNNLLDYLKSKGE